MSHNQFFNDADFDISANIESALAEISFSAIELPDDLAGNKSLFGSKSKEASMLPEKSFTSSLNMTKYDQTSQFDKSFASSVLDKAVMDNLDLTFTETLQKGQPARRLWKTKAKRSSNDTILNDEIDLALKSIPDKLNFSITEPSKAPVARTFGILKAPKAPLYHQQTMNSYSNNNYDLGDMTSLKKQLEQLRKNSATSTPAAPVRPAFVDISSEECLMKLRELKRYLEKQIEAKRNQRLTENQNTDKLSQLNIKDLYDRY